MSNVPRQRKTRKNRPAQQRAPSLAVDRRAVTNVDRRAYREARVVIAALKSAEKRRGGTRQQRQRAARNSPRPPPGHLGRLHPAWEAWVRALHFPSGHRGVQCPINENPAPSNIVLSPTVTWNSETILVDAGRCVQIVIFPGRSVQAAGTVSFDNAVNPAGTVAVTEPGPGDEVAVHSKLQAYCAQGQAVPDTVVAVGPVPVNVVVNVAGVATSVGVSGALGLISSGLISDDALLAGNGTCWAGGAAGATSAGKWIGMLPENAIGLTANPDTTHMRWKLTSCDLYARNITPEASRGGGIVTAMPSNKYYESDQSNQTFIQGRLDRYGTFRVHGDEAYMAWVPRPGELAFNHAATSAQQATSSLQGLHFSSTPYLEGAGMFMFLNNSTSSVQTFRVSLCQNYDIAGQGVSQLGRKAEHHPQLLPAVQAGIAIATGGETGIGHAMALGAEKAAQGAVGIAEKVAGTAKSFAKTLVSHAADAAGTALGLAA